MAKDWASLTFCLCSCFFAFSINIVVLILGIYVNRSGSVYYGTILKVETLEWSKAPIVSLSAVPPSGMCASGSTVVHGNFSGIYPRCNYIGGGYRIGVCRRHEGLYTSFGINPVPFTDFDNQKMCANRDPTLDYHQLSQMRSGRSSCLSNTI
jgi:hypothetical protein